MYYWSHSNALLQTGTMSDCTNTQKDVLLSTSRFYSVLGMENDRMKVIASFPYLIAIGNTVNQDILARGRAQVDLQQVGRMIASLSEVCYLKKFNTRRILTLHISECGSDREGTRVLLFHPA